MPSLSPAAELTPSLTVHAAISTELGILIAALCQGDLPSHAAALRVADTALPLRPINAAGSAQLMRALISADPAAGMRCVLFLPWDAAHDAPPSQLLCLFGTGQAQLITLDALPYGEMKLPDFQRHYNDYAPAFGEVLALALPADHGLRRILAHLPATASAASGHFDVIRNHCAVGWAWDPRHPEQRPLIEIVYQDRVVASGRAQHLRPDLKAAKIGDGCYQFHIPLSLTLRDDIARQLTARFADSHAPLNGVHDYRALAPALPLLDQIGMDDVQRMAAPLGASYLARLLHADSKLSFDNATAHLLLQQLLDSTGEQALTLCKLGEACLHSGRNEEAAQAYRRAIATAQCGHHGYLGLGNSYARMERWDDAATAYLSGLQPMPGRAVLLQRWRDVRGAAGRQLAEQALQSGRDGHVIDHLADLLLDAPADAQLERRLSALIAKGTRVGSEAEGVTEFRRDLQLLDRLLDAAARRQQQRPA